MSDVCCNKEHIYKYHMILWQRWVHGSSSVANYQILNCGFEHFINYCDYILLPQINFLCKSNFMKFLLSAAYHQCNIFSNHFTYSPSTSLRHRLWPSPSITNIIIITITIMVFVITLSILQWTILYPMLCVPSLWVCVIVFKHIPS